MLTFLDMIAASSLFSVDLSYVLPTSDTKSFTVPHKNLSGERPRVCSDLHKNYHATHSNKVYTPGSEPNILFYSVVKQS